VITENRSAIGGYSICSAGLRGVRITEKVWAVITEVEVTIERLVTVVNVIAAVVLVVRGFLFF
jgi:hypothetical protein